MPRRHLVDAHCFGADRRVRLTDDDGSCGATANQGGSERRSTTPEKFHTKLTSRRNAKSRFNVVAAALGQRQNASVRTSARRQDALVMQLEVAPDNKLTFQ